MKALKYFFITGIFVLLFSGQSFSQSGWETVFSGKIVTGIALKGDNIICSTTSGIECINKKTFESITSNVEGDMIDNTITSVAVDSDNNIWFGTYKGKIIKDDGQKWTDFSISENLSGSQITMIYCAKDSKIWASTSVDGIYIFNGTTWDKFDKDFGKDNIYVMKMTEDSNNNTWFATNNGLYLYDGTSLTAYGSKNGLPGDFIIRMCVDTNNVLWAVSYGGGIFRQDGSIWTEVIKDKTEEIRILSKITEPKTILSQIIHLERIYYLSNNQYVDFEFKNSCPEISFIPPVEGSNFEYSFNVTTAYAREINDINGDGDLSDGITLTIYDVQGAIEGSSFDWTYGRDFEENVIASFDVGPDGTLWGGTRTGIVRYDGDKKTAYTTADGLVGGYVTSLIVENDGTVWASSENGLSKYTPSTTSVNSDKNLPETFKINGNYPNPFNPQTTISFSLPDEKPISLVIYNINGQEIQTLFSGKMKSGVHNILWNGKNSAGENVSSGIYLVVLKSGSMEVSHRMQLVR